MAYSPNLGRWIEQDPIGYLDGKNIYLFERGTPVTALDPTGLAAWKHTQYWDMNNNVQQFRDFVRDHSVDYLGRTEDCADLALTMLVDFASSHGLPVTFRVLTGHLLISKSCAWSTKAEFLAFVLRKLGANTLFMQNTGADIMESAVQSADLLVNAHHAAVVVNAMKPGDLSKGQVRAGDAVEAAPGVRPWDEAAAEHAPNDLKWIYNPTSTDGYRIDYLNHTGSANRQKAEMKFNRRISDLTEQGFHFRFWHPIVFSNYKTWPGTPKLASEY